MIMKLKAEARAQGGCRANEKKKYRFANFQMKFFALPNFEMYASFSIFLTNL
jgi:hypothetical protein